MSRKSVKFLHLADLHLDQPLGGGKLKLPHDKAQKRSREQRRVLEKALKLARREKVDVILIAGDFWEEESLQPDTVPFVVETLSAVDIPVVIAPGNHDYNSPASHYATGILQARFGKTWGKNIHIFNEHQFTHLTLPELEGVCITGIAYHSPDAVRMRRLGTRLETPDADIRLAVIHGSRDDTLPPGKTKTLPFSVKELLKQPFDYTALGHYHTRSTIEDSKGRIRAAYPGSTCGLTVDETGERGVLVGVAEPGGVAPENLVFHKLDERRIFRIQLDISGLTHAEAVERRIGEVLGETGVEDADITLVELTGTHPGGSRIAFSGDFIREACFHLRVDVAQVRPEWDPESEEESTNTTQGLFRARLREMITAAAERGDDDEATRLQNALFYGLDALHGEQIIPRNTG